MKDYDFDYEVDDEENPSELTFYCDEELTSLWGDNAAIRSVIDERIAMMFNGSKVSYDLSYNDTGDSGNNATFHCTNIRLER